MLKQLLEKIAKQLINNGQIIIDVLLIIHILNLEINSYQVYFIVKIC